MSETHGTPLYDELGDSYDVMVSWADRLRREAPFLEEVFSAQEAHTILDIGCGTGWHAIHCAQKGYEAVGIDPSAEMIRRARDNARGVAGVQFIQGAFNGLSRSVPRSFDAALCLGNTLPHLLTEEDLVDALREVASVLKPGGSFIIQQLNYDRILASHQRFLGLSSGTRDGTTYLFFRFYDFLDDLLQFNMVTITGAEGKWDYRTASTMLQPITVEQLKSGLASTGFADWSLYGSYAGEPFDPSSSNDLIVVARRRRSS